MAKAMYLHPATDSLADTAPEISRKVEQLADVALDALLTVWPAHK